MSESSNLAEVLAGHWSVSTHGNQDKCDGCGAVVHEWGQEVPYGAPHPLAHHQRAVILEALASEAEAEAAAALKGRFLPRMANGEPFPDMSEAARAARWLRARL